MVGENLFISVNRVPPPAEESRLAAGGAMGAEFSRPLLNEVFIIPGTSTHIITRPPNFAQKFLPMFRQTPEVVSMIYALVTDVLSDGFFFEGKEVNRKRALEFVKENNIQIQLEAFLYDYFILGNGFIWVGKLTKNKAKEMAKLFLGSRKFNNPDFAARILAKTIDEQSYDHKIFLALPASTMNITPSDRTATVFRYSQRVGAARTVFDEKDVLHIKDMNIDGKMWGMSRFEPVLAEVTLLALLKNYYGHEMDNYGVPPGIFSFPDEQPFSPNITSTRRLLEEGKKSENKNKPWVMSGNLVYTKLDRLNDMEFKNLTEYLTQVIAMTWQVPPARWGGSAQKGGEASLSNQAYERSILHIRNKITAVLNTEFFIPEFKVEIKFHKSHIEDEVRVSQADKVATDVVEQKLRLGLINKQAALKKLEIPIEDAGDDALTKAAFEPAPSNFNQVGVKNDTLKPQAKKQVDKLKAPKNRSAASDVRAKK